MAPKTFPRFCKLPMELRLRIWNLSMEPRVIKAKWDNIVSREYIYQVYVLAAGPAPRVLHVCKESRREAERKYCLVKSRLPFQPGGNYQHKPWARSSIWINFEIDTLYFVNMPTMLCFVSYMRRLSMERIGGADKNIKYIAIHACVMDRIFRNLGVPNKLHYFYRLVAEVPSIQQIIIMLDNSKFDDDKRPEFYSLSRPYSLPNKSAGGFPGGRWGCKRVRDEINLKLGEFFTSPRGQEKEVETFRKYKLDNPDLALPTFTMLSITKTPKHGYASDGLPLNQIPKRRTAPNPKPAKVLPKPTKTIAAKV